MVMHEEEKEEEEREGEDVRCNSSPRKHQPGNLRVRFTFAINERYRWFFTENFFNGSYYTIQRVGCESQFGQWHSLFYYPYSNTSARYTSCCTFHDTCISFVHTHTHTHTETHIVDKSATSTSFRGILHAPTNTRTDVYRRTRVQCGIRETRGSLFE